MLLRWVAHLKHAHAFRREEVKIKASGVVSRVIWLSENGVTTKTSSIKYRVLSRLNIKRSRNDRGLHDRKRWFEDPEVQCR